MQEILNLTKFVINCVTGMCLSFLKFYEILIQKINFVNFVLVNIVWLIFISKKIW